MGNKDHLFITSDFGTQGVRVGIADINGNLLHTHEVKFPLNQPKSGYATQDSQDWWSSFRGALHVVLGELTDEQKNNIQSMSTCATSSTVVPVDEKGDGLAEAMMWMDIRSKDVAKRINETAHEVLNYCGNSVSPEWFIPKMVWLKENERELYDKAFLIVEQLDFINHKLTHQWVASKVNAVCKWNYIDGAGFDQEYMEEIGLEDYQEKMITNVIPMGALVGPLTEELAKEFGINPVPVYQGGIDAHIGTAGMGVVKAGQMGVNMGTSFVQLIFTDTKQPVEGIWGPYNGAMIEGLTLLEAGQISAGAIVKWYQRVFNLNGPDGFEIMAKEIAEIPIGSDGLLMLDFFQGNRTPFKDDYAKGAIYGLHLNHSRAHIHRAILEAVAMGFKNIVTNFENHGVSVDEVICTGGVTFDKTWMQIIADATGKELIINENTNYGTLIGPAMIAAVGAGSFQNLEEAASFMTHKKETIIPNLENMEKYDALFDDYLALYHSTKPLSVPV